MQKLVLLGVAALALSSTAMAQRLICADSSRAMFEVNPLTGARTAIGTISANAGVTGGLARDPATGTIWVSSTGNDALYTLDLATGAATLVGLYGDPLLVMHGLEWDSSTGTLYGMSSHNNGFYSISTATGVATLIGLSGFAGAFPNLGHNSRTNVLYATNGGNDSLYTIDRATGLATLVGAMAGPTNPNALAYSVDSSTMYLCDNSLDNLYTLNLTTGAATLVGPLGASNIICLMYIPGAIYDNGPLLTPPPGNGFGGANTSVLQTVAPNVGTTFGYTASAAFRLADDFYLDGPGNTVITQVELFAYQSGSPTAPSTLTGMFIEITAGDPSAGGVPVPGSPGIAVNLATAGLISNAWTGMYRVTDTALLGSTRPIMAIRCELPAPIILGPGTNYWITYAMSGTLAVGPFVPPVTILNALGSGNAKQLNVGTGVWTAITNGAGNFAGVPFRFYGVGQRLGSIADGVAGCGAAGLRVMGAPNLGGVLRVEMTNVSPAPSIPILGFDFAPLSVVVCNNGVTNCIAGHNFSFPNFFVTATTIRVPVNAGLFGVLLACQGAEFMGAGACAAPNVAFTNSINVTLHNGL